MAEVFAAHKQSPGEKIVPLGGGVVALVNWPAGDPEPRQWYSIVHGPDLERARQKAIQVSGDAYDLAIIWRQEFTRDGRRVLAEAWGRQAKFIGDEGLWDIEGG